MISIPRRRLNIPAWRRKLPGARLVLSLVAALVGGHVLAQETLPQNPVLGLDTAMAESPAFDDLLAEGHAYLYNLDYEEAMDTFERSMVLAPEHPGPYAWQATVLWLREVFRRGDLDLDGYVDVSKLRRDKEGDAEDGKRDAEEEERRTQLDEDGALAARGGAVTGAAVVGGPRGMSCAASTIKDCSSASGRATARL